MNIQKYKLATMFSIMFAGAFITISAFFYYYNYIKQVNTQNEVLKSQANSILDFADVLLESRNEKFFSGESSEVPQIIQNEVFDKFTTISGGNVFFKEASKTPSNSKNLANKNEAETIDTFKENRTLKEVEKFIQEAGKEYYSLSRPIIAENKCKLCHPTWKEGDVIAIENVKIDLAKFNEAIQENTILTISTGFINILIILLLTHYLFSKYVSKRIVKLLEIIFRVEKGNFVIDDLIKDEQLEQGSSQNEVDRLFRHIQKMVGTLNPVIKSVVTTSKDISFQSSYSYIKVNDTSTHVDLENDAMKKSQTMIEEVVHVNQEMIESLGTLIAKSTQSQETILSSKADVEHSLIQGSEAAAAMDNASHSITDLKLSAKEVSKMIDVITDIADETNLIALNAAIEAARAGEHGRSFSVVADKIRELADVSRSNADDIFTILKKIDTHVDKVSETSLDSKEKVLSLIETSKTIDNSFNNIDKTFQSISLSLDTFNDDFSNEYNMLKNVKSNLDDIQKSSNELVDSAHSTKEMMYEISLESAKLKTLADGFELISNNRKNDRSVLTPPASAIDTHNNKIYIFDISEHGISFYYHDVKLQKNIEDVINLKFENKLNSMKSLSCQIVYISKDIMESTHFYGAKILSSS